MTHHLRVPRGAVAAAGAILGLGVGLAATAQATTPSPPTTSKTPPAPPAGPGGPLGGPGGPGPRGPRGGPGGGGTLTKVSSSSITYAGPDGVSRTAALNASTTYTRDGTTATESDLTLGEHVDVRLVNPSATPAVAESVDIHSPHLGGTVLSDNGSTIVVIDGDGFHRTIRTNGSTTYTKSGSSATSAAVTTGQHLDAVGSIDPDGTDLDATRVNVGLPPRPTPPAPPAGSSSTTKGSSSTG